MKLWRHILAQALLYGTCLANPAKPLLVISTQGPVPIEFASGTILDADTVLRVPARSQVTLLVLGQGKRLRLTGPCTARWDAAARTVKTDQGHSEELSGSAHKLQLSGENTRILAGFTTRQGEKPEVTDNPWAFELPPGIPGVLILYRKSGFPLLEPVNIKLETPCRVFEFEADLARLTRQGEDLKTTEVAILQNQEIGGRQVFKVPIPESLSGRIGVKVLQAHNVCYFTCIRPWTQVEAQELSNLKKSTAEWSVREPGNPEPFVVYAVAAEELGQLEEARQAVKAALKIRPDAGLYRLACRIQMQSGNYASASQLYRAASALGPPRKGL